MLNENSCPVCGERLSETQLSEGSCPFCGRKPVGDSGPGEGRDGSSKAGANRDLAVSLEPTATVPVEPPAKAAEAEHVTPVCSDEDLPETAAPGPLLQPGKARTQEAPGPPESLPVPESRTPFRATGVPGGSPLTPRESPGSTPRSEPGVPDREKLAAGVREALDEDTVGAFKTVPPSVGESLVQWQEGLLVADRFRIVRFIGQGGMGSVYLAQDETLGRPIALKRVPQEIVFDPDARDDLRQEANRLLDLAHENIVRIHTFYEGPTWPFFAMEYLQGPTLKKLLRQRKQYGRTFSPKEVLIIARQVAQGLAYAHAKGVIHRDLKPGNLMLAAPPGEEITEADVIKITDFGISRVIADSTLRHTGKRSGTLAYMSPEQFHGEPCTVQSDVYSFACTLYELLSGNPPFHSGDIGYQIVHVPPKPLEGVPKAMAAAILRALSKDPRRRFRSVGEFMDALEGRAAAPARVSRAAKLRTAVAVVALAMLVVAVPWIAHRYLGGYSATSPTSAAGNGGTGSLPGEAKALRDEKNAFASRLSAELLKQIPSILGRKHEAAFPAAPGSVSLAFSVSEPTGSSYQRALFEGLFFQYYSNDPKDVKTARGSTKGGRKSFLLESLREGMYTIRAYSEMRAGRETVVVPLLDDRPVKLTVDLTPPSFEIEFVNRDVLVSEDPALYTTFDDKVELRIHSPGSSEEIAEAWWQVVRDGGGGGKFPVESSRSTSIALLPGVTTVCRFQAKDAAGNESEIREIRIRRLNLQVDLFRLASGDGVYGNVARIQGVLKVEGDRRPALRYFVNGEMVSPEPLAGEGDMLASSGGSSSGDAGIPFVAAIRLPNPSANTIEVRYAWKGNPPKPFAVPAQITGVAVKAPAVTFAVEPPKYTNSPRLRIEGRVEPVFEDLELYLDCVGKGNARLQVTRISPEPPIGVFSQEIELEPDRENTFRVICFYRKEQLPSSPLSFSIFCDTRKPRLADRVRFETGENRLELAISPGEELQQLRVREIWAGTEGGVWRPAEWDLASFTYRYATRLPQSPVSFQLELTDLAGNVAVFEETFYPSGAAARKTAESSEAAPFEATPAAGSIGAEEVRAASSTLRPIARARGVLWLISPFLEELRMDFVPFGHDRWEMARIEVPERAWFQFLREVKGRASLRQGALDVPMTLQDDSPDLLREFVKWFGERSGDGYVYEIPTADQWIEAFAGGPADSARERVRAWFAGKASPGFVSNPRVRYGQNVVLAIGSRPENRTPSGLLDMEGNVQEIVRVGEELQVIGGSNRDATASEIEARCLSPRPYDAKARIFQGAVTGLRLCRRPASAFVEKER